MQEIDDFVAKPGYPQTETRAYDQAFGNHKLPVLNHSGLEVGGEQATTIYYCSQGKWIQLAGSD